MRSNVEIDVTDSLTPSVLWFFSQSPFSVRSPSVVPSMGAPCDVATNASGWGDRCARNESAPGDPQASSGT